MSADESNPIHGQTLARRITSRATNLLACGLVLIAGLTVGRELLDWWHVARSSNSEWDQSITANQRGAGAGPSSHAALRFGNHSTSMYRRDVHGDRAEVLQELRRISRMIVDSTPQSTTAVPPNKWLDDIIALPPVDRVAGRWTMHELAEPLPVVAVVSDAEAEDGPNNTAGVADRSLLAWGIGFPIPGGWPTWRLFVFSPLASSDQAEANLALPDGCTRILSIHDTEHTIVGFRSEHSLDTLAERWDSMQAVDWRPSAPWRQTKSTRHRRYEVLSGGYAEVLCAMDSQGQVIGFVQVDHMANRASAKPSAQ